MSNCGDCKTELRGSFYMNMGTRGGGGFETLCGKCKDKPENHGTWRKVGEGSDQPTIKPIQIASVGSAKAASIAALCDDGSIYIIKLEDITNEAVNEQWMKVLPLDGKIIPEEIAPEETEPEDAPEEGNEGEEK